MRTKWELQRLSYQARLAGLEMVSRTGTGHIASAFSIAEILTAILAGVFDGKPGGSDRFVLSKGHGGLMMYALAEVLGKTPPGYNSSYMSDGGRLPAFPHSRTLPDLSFSSGSLGHGLSYGAGLAYAGRLRATESRVFAVLSDGECQEGSVWEAANFAGHHRLHRLVVVVDSNRLQALDEVSQVLDQTALSDRFRTFGFQCIEVDGHDISQLLHSLQAPTRKPKAIIAHTVKGKGVSFMEDSVNWHYLPVDEDLTKIARKELTQALCAIP